MCLGCAHIHSIKLNYRHLNYRHYTPRLHGRHSRCSAYLPKAGERLLAVGERLPAVGERLPSVETLFVRLRLLCVNPFAFAAATPCTKAAARSAANFCSSSSSLCFSAWVLRIPVNRSIERCCRSRPPPYLFSSTSSNNTFADEIASSVTFSSTTTLRVSGLKIG